MSVLLAEKTLAELAKIAGWVGWGAGEIILDYYYGSKEKLGIQNNKDGPVTAADLAANEYILKQLRIACGSQEFGYLTEETYKLEKDKSFLPLPQPFVWIIDPIDGTRDFIEHTDNFALHIALIYQNRPVVSVVALPALGKLYSAYLGGGTFVENQEGIARRLPVLDGKGIEACCLVGSRTHRNERFNQLLKRFPCQNQTYVGSIGCKMTLIAEGKADVYIYLSGKTGAKDWDFAAPELILTEAGGRFSHSNGGPVLYNTGDVSQWGCLVASSGKFHEDLCREAEKILAEL
ncbi:3'(2'),5'-bisphosphate nucleotidase CysQ [Ancylothrix sp. C2]|uniref:3'(2'),5'-bisphosphate nucleotidase CysQ family protein n=1 Tax=Ancylothrix sp. D3o TaxID=2953691 RepID=UPI0021BAFE97|nr:inositol monophosphatase family protein [Ancylothrix sp. D3o]MCT7950531.1 3'(2'),5'-bisphosphate nucleotidase CysQ [Ancylothrix sp. D3o]